MISIGEAWRILGENPDEIILELKSKPDISSRIAAAEKALNRAEIIAKALLGAHHPDRYPDDSKAAKRFLRVKEAIESIRFHTEDFKKKAYTSRSQGKKDRFIVDR
jgi:hypothetical protein